MTDRISRRSFLKASGTAGAAGALASAGPSPMLAPPWPGPTTTCPRSPSRRRPSPSSRRRWSPASSARGGSPRPTCGGSSRSTCRGSSSTR
ncbi:MAG TPA: twin-arginine translocation signal domain-containing protein [Actinomycetes bacterium]|nr:twin-arginine translocation signal domain-containing protein [Actinomycetes bacterium]